MRPQRSSPLSPLSRRALVAASSLLLLTLAAGCKRRPTTPSGKPVAAPNTAKYAGELSPMIASSDLSFLRWPRIGDYGQPLSAFYNGRELELAWSRDGHPTAQATALIDAFTHADTVGLRPEDYDADRWPARLHDLSTGDHTAVAQFDVALTVDAMRYLTDIHMGRVAPQFFNFEIDRHSKAFDLPQFLNDQLLEASDVPAVVHSLEPDSDDYRKTLDALHHYQELAKLEADNPREPLPDPGKNLSVGDHYIAGNELEQRLVFEGYQAATAGVAGQDPSHRYTPAAASAVKEYQARHGISPDGKLGSVTVKSLNVPMTVRVQQLEDALERWRWLPEPYLHPRLLVNLPEFLLRGYTPTGPDAQGHQLDFTMRVVVGKAKDNHDTPVFTHMMKYLIFRPFWNVPVSIIKAELVPHVAANPGYLEEKGYEVRGRSGKEIADYNAHSLEHDGYLVRMKPGPSNALGLIKFMFPNQYDIYLHSTPEVSLFSRQKRDFSHGCIRVQHPDELAVWVLNGQDDTKTHQPWDLQTVDDAMQTGDDNRQVSLKTQLPIDILYLTAHVDDDGNTDFFDDLYGYDADLEKVLDQGPPYPTKPTPVTPKTAPGDTV